MGTYRSDLCLMCLLLCPWSFQIKGWACESAADVGGFKMPNASYYISVYSMATFKHIYDDRLIDRKTIQLTSIGMPRSGAGEITKIVSDKENIQIMVSLDFIEVKTLIV